MKMGRQVWNTAALTTVVLFGTDVQEVGVMDIEASETRSPKSLNPVGESKEDCSVFEPII